MTNRILFILIIGMFLLGCKSVQIPITDEQPQTSTTRIEYRDRLMRDTTYVHDSIYIHDKGDTVYVTRWRDKYTERIQVDTCYYQRTDTIKLVKRVYYKEPLTKWESFKIELGGWLLGILLLLLAWVVWKIFKR